MNFSLRLLKKIFRRQPSPEESWTKERLETFIFNETTVEHLHRYNFAADLLSDKRVLDIACGEGYGPHLLSHHARSVVGVDSCPTAIENAQRRYRKENLSFVCGDIEKIPFPANSFDAVVSFETLEHVLNHEQVFSEFCRVLTRGGILIISSPDKKYYSDLINYSNPHHKKELYEKEFKDLVSKYFAYQHFYYQKYTKGSVIHSDKSPQISKWMSGNFQKTDQSCQLYGRFLIATASQQPLAPTEDPGSFYLSDGICD